MNSPVPEPIPSKDATDHPPHVLIIGSNGALGSDLVKIFNPGWTISGLEQSQLDVTQPEQVRQQLQKLQPDVVINTAAYNRVADAETHAADAYLVNGNGPATVAAAAWEIGAVCVHYSTDYVFDGEANQPYTEEDRPWPINVYGASKLVGERAVLSASPQNLVLRTTGLYGETPTVTKGENFVQTIWRLARGQSEISMSDREICSPTWTLELAHQTRILVEAKASGLFHAVAGGACSWMQFAEAILQISGQAVKVKPNLTPESRFQRPRYTALDNARLTTLGLNRMRPWRESLEEFLRGESGQRLRALSTPK